MKKKNLILGSSGFIGKKLSVKLKKKFIIFNSINKKDSFEKIKKFLIKNKIKYIINLVNNNRQKIKMIKYNTNLLNIIKSHDIKIILFSTSLIYGFTNKPSDERAKIKPFNNYTRNKSSIERLYKNSKMNYKIIRLSNVYEDEFKKKGIFKNLINCVKKKNIYIKFNNLKIYRNFIHIDNVVNMLENLILNYDTIEEKIINFGGENLKLKNIITLFNKKFRTKVMVKINKNKIYDPSVKINSKLSNKLFKNKKLTTLNATLNKFKIKK